MKLDDYKTLIKFINERSTKLLIKKGEIQPHAFLVRSNIKTGIEILMFPFNPETVINDLSPAAKEFEPECIITVSEAWLSGSVDGGRPSEQSDRREIFFVNSEHIEHGLIVVTSEISRTESGKIKSVQQEPDSDKITEVKGRLSDLLSKFSSEETVSSIKRHPGYKSHFKSDKYTVH
jgi:hypothetical protein